MTRRAAKKVTPRVVLIVLSVFSSAGCCGWVRRRQGGRIVLVDAARMGELGVASSVSKRVIHRARTEPEGRVRVTSLADKKRDSGSNLFADVEEAHKGGGPPALCRVRRVRQRVREADAGEVVRESVFCFTETYFILRRSLN